MGILSMIVAIVIAAVISGFVIWIVGKLGLGLEVAGFGPAFIAAIVIAVIAGVITWFLGLLHISLTGGFIAGVINLIVAAVVLLLAGRIVPGLKVKGFVGALIAAIAIGVVGWLVAWVLSLFGL